MKKTVFSLLLTLFVTGAFSQMQVWSNGTIIFNHPTSEVDSISFSGGQMKAQVIPATSSVTSLEGLTFGATGSSSRNSMFGLEYYLCFISASKGMLVKYATFSGQSGSEVSNRSEPFTYSISGETITIVTVGSTSDTYNGTLIGGDAIYMDDLVRSYDSHTSSYVYLDRFFLRIK